MNHHPRTLIQLIGNTCYTLQAQLKSSACQPNPSQSLHQHVVTLTTTCHLRNDEVTSSLTPFEIKNEPQ